MRRIDKDPDPIELVGHVDRDKTVLFHQKAKVALHPVQIPESFGLSIAESMACGTPVVAFANGSTPELVKDGETGFLVNPKGQRAGNWIVKKTGEAGFVEAIERINRMSERDYLDMRKRSREHVLAHFTLEEMTKNYEKLYLRVLGSS